MSGELLGLAPVARLAFAGADLEPVKAQLLSRLARDESDASALLDLSTVLQLMGQRQLGLSAQTLALDLRQVYGIEPSVRPASLRLLAFVCPGDLTENNAIELLVEHSDIALDLLYVAPGLPLPAAVPDHDVAMVAICETDRNRPILAHLARLVESWPRRVLCAPARIARLSRDGACELLQSIPGLVAPLTTRVDRQELASFVKSGGIPVIVRPVDSQKGQGLAKIDAPAGLADYLRSRPEDAFYVSRFVAYRSPDGQYRKYRLVLIKGRPYACHMAISGNWVVHYLSAGMCENASKRAEEAQFFATFNQAFARRHRQALRAIAERVELEYVGIDCGETPAGELLIFEVDSGMTVHAMDPVDLFPYKQPQMQKVFDAFRQMLLSHSVPMCGVSEPVAALP